MPKVSEAHSEQKRQEILAAARRVCESKPLYSVTMKEIVLESGMSQGGVYKYFSNLDAVFAALLNEAALNRRAEAAVAAIVDADLAPGLKLEALLRYLGQYIQETVESGGKIYFELLALYAGEPDRFLAIRNQLVEVSVLEYIQKRLVELLLEGVAAGSFRPVLPLEDLLAFMRASITGITQDLIGARRAGCGASDGSRLMGVLARSVQLLLAGPGEGFARLPVEMEQRR